MLYIILISTFLLLTTLFFIRHTLRLRTLRVQGWEHAKSSPVYEPHAHSYWEGDTRWLFAGPVGSRAQLAFNMTTHYPVYFLRIVQLYLIRLPRFGFQLLASSIRHGRLCYRSTFSHETLYQLFINGPLIIMAERKGDQLEIRVPEIPLRTNVGLNPSGFHLVVNSQTHRVEVAEWKGEDLLGDSGRILTLMLVALVMWAHPQTHRLAEMSAREIANKQVEVLEPSNRFVVALHHGLLYGDFSPLANNTAMSINVDAKSGVKAASTVPMKHVIENGKMEFRYYRFLWEGRRILMRLMKQYGLDVNAEALFNNMLVHSVDHYFLYKRMKGQRAWSFDGGDGIRSYWRSQMFITVWVRQVSSPFLHEKISRMNAKKYPFYHALYQQLAQVDVELANCILASTSF